MNVMNSRKVKTIALVAHESIRFCCARSSTHAFSYIDSFSVDYPQLAYTPSSNWSDRQMNSTDGDFSFIRATGVWYVLRTCNVTITLTALLMNLKTIEPDDVLT